MSTLTQLDRLECFLWLLQQEIATRVCSKSKAILLPSIQYPKPDQVLFWEGILRICGQPLLYIQDLGRLQEVARQSKIIEELPIHSGVLLLEKKPAAFRVPLLKKTDPVFEKNLRNFAKTTSFLPRGDSPTFVF